MKKAAAPAKRAQKRVVATKATEIKITQAHEFQPVKALSGFTLQGSSVVNDTQAKMLLDIKTIGGKPFIDINDSPTLFEILMNIRSFGFESVYADLTKRAYVSANDYIFNRMEAEKKAFVNKFVSDLIIDRVEKGLYRCNRCKKEGRVDDNTVSFTSVHRADESSHSNVLCNTCGLQWRAA